jgi:hypothetical protein
MPSVANYVPVWAEGEHLTANPTGNASTGFSRTKLGNISLLFCPFFTRLLQLCHIGDFSARVTAGPVRHEWDYQEVGRLWLSGAGQAQLPAHFGEFLYGEV